MSATCRFCGSSFTNEQAVRAHLKACPDYRQHRAERDAGESGDERTLSLREASVRDTPAHASGSLPQGSPRRSPRGDRPGRPGMALPDAPARSFDTAGFDPVHQLQQRIAAEELRLKLREVEDAHEEMDRRSAAKAEQRIGATQRQREAQTSAERQAEEQRRREQRARDDQARKAAAADELRLRRRAIIQDVKADAMAWWMHGTELKAEALTEIERTLTPLPVEDLPHAELVDIAAGIAERFAGQAIAAQRQAVEVREHREKLTAHGLAYLRSQLAEIDDLAFTDRYRIEELARHALDAITGAETSTDVEDLIDDLLDREGYTWVDEDE